MAETIAKVLALAFGICHALPMSNAQATRSAAKRQECRDWIAFYEGEIEYYAHRPERVAELKLALANVKEELKAWS